MSSFFKNVLDYYMSAFILHTVMIKTTVQTTLLWQLDNSMLGLKKFIICKDTSCRDYVMQDTIIIINFIILFYVVKCDYEICIKD